MNAGRYRHGQRSVEAVITMMTEKAAASTPLGRTALPADFLLDMQVDRGPLDPETIGGLIGLSGGGFPTGTEREDRDDIWVKFAQSVWKLGATVAYGGNWSPGGLTQILIDLSLPSRLRRDGVDEPRLEIHATTAPPTSDPRVTVVMVPAPSVPGATKSVLKAAHLFRMRWQSAVRCRARIVLSGKTDAYSGRMPGIVEEAMIALALRQPIYVLGGFGGAAQLVGELLGLATTTSPPISLAPTSLDLNAVAHLFRRSGFEELPLSTEEALSYIAGRAIGGPGWTPNGLTVAENRTLLRLRGNDPEECEEAVRLVRRDCYECSINESMTTWITTIILRDVRLNLRRSDPFVTCSAEATKVYRGVLLISAQSDEGRTSSAFSQQIAADQERERRAPCRQRCE